MQLSIVSFAQTTADYVDNLNNLKGGLSGLGALAATQDLGQNLLMWMSSVYSPNSAQRYTLVGTPLRSEEH
eukprot:gene7115-9064_t